MANDYLGQAGLTALIAKIKTAISTAVSGLLTKSDADGYYQAKGNIPRSDLASDVQTSLGKADTALQSFTETDPTVPSWAKASSKPTYTASEVGAATSADITSAINSLDVSSIGGDGKYIKLISETDGKISATAADMPTSLPPTSHTHSRDDINYPSVKTLSWSKANDLQIYYMNSKKVMSFYFGGSTASYNQGFTIDVMHGGTTASIMITWQNNAGASGSLHVGYSVVGNDAGNSKWNVSYFKVADSGDVFIFVYTDVALTDSDSNAYTLKFTGITDKSIYVNEVDPTNTNFKNSTSASLQAIGISRGGTNATTAKEILYNIRNGITDWTTPVDDEVIFAVNSNNTNAGHYTFKKVWDNYLDGKVSSSYAKKLPTSGTASDTYAINISGCSDAINSRVTSDDRVYYVGFLNTAGIDASYCWMRTGGTGNLNGTAKLTYNPNSNLLCANLNGSAYRMGALKSNGSGYYYDTWSVRWRWSGDDIFLETYNGSSWTADSVILRARKDGDGNEITSTYARAVDVRYSVNGLVNGSYDSTVKVDIRTSVPSVSEISANTLYAVYYP